MEYHVGLTWKQSATTVEEMRKGIWKKEYSTEQDRTYGRLAKLKDDRDDFE